METSSFVTPPSGATSLPTGVDFGSSLAVSGIRLAVGARETGGGKGFVTIYRTDTDPWTVEETSLRATGSAIGDQFGYHVAMDGDVLVVGAPFHRTNNLQESGAAYIFNRSGSTWSEGPMLTAPTVQSFAEFGHSVAIAGDLIAVGAPRANSGVNQSGAVHIFQFDSGTGTWPHVRTLTAPTAVLNDWFGFAIAIEGTTLVVGAPRRNLNATDAGALFVYDLSDSAPANWSLTATLQNPAPVADQRLGYSVAIHADIIAAGAPLDFRSHDDCDPPPGFDPRPGAVHLFRHAGGLWAHEETLRIPPPICGLDTNYFGTSVTLTDQLLLAGATGEPASSSFNLDAYLFNDTPTGWRLTRELIHGQTVYDLFGGAVAFIDTDTALIGAPQWIDFIGDTVPGRVHVFNTSFADCNSNGIDDCIELAICAALDCNGNGIPDCCDIDSEFSEDLNNNGIPDECEERLDCGASDPTDCNNNLIPDECERAGQYDLVFVIDQSGSIGEIEWLQQLQAISIAVCGYEDSSITLPELILPNGNARVAVVTYSDNNLDCATQLLRIPLTRIDEDADGSDPLEMTPAAFCSLVLSLDLQTSGAFTYLSGGLACALEQLEAATDPYRRQVVVMGDGGISGGEGEYAESIEIADTLRRLASDMSIEGLSAGVSFLQIQFACTGPIIFSDFMSALVNQPFEPPFRPCLPSGLWECAVSDAAGLHAALRRMIFQNLLRCPGASEDVPFCGLTPWMWDRNGNGIPDCIDILTRHSLDLDEDGIPDECQDGSLGPCPADLNNDCGVDSGDLIILLSAWGPCGSGPCPADLDGNGTVDSADLLELLNAWGACYSMDTSNPCTQQASPRYVILPPQSIADCMARYSGDTAELIGCIEAMILAGTP